MWIVCTGVKYCSLCGVVCVAGLYWSKVLCVGWCCVYGFVILV